MDNEMTIKLADSIKKAKSNMQGREFSCELERNFFFAEQLIADGVIVPPCKVGDKVYCVCTFVDDDFCEGCEFYYGGGMGDMPCCDATRCGQRKKECLVVCEGVATEKEIYWWLYMYAFGKTVFLTKAEAEQKLKEMRAINE